MTWLFYYHWAVHSTVSWSLLCFPAVSLWTLLLLPCLLVILQTYFWQAVCFVKSYTVSPCFFIFPLVLPHHIYILFNLGFPSIAFRSVDCLVPPLPVYLQFPSSPFLSDLETLQIPQNHPSSPLWTNGLKCMLSGQGKPWGLIYKSV